MGIICYCQQESTLNLTLFDLILIWLCVLFVIYCKYWNRYHHAINLGCVVVPCKRWQYVIGAQIKVVELSLGKISKFTPFTVHISWFVTIHKILTFFCMCLLEIFCDSFFFFFFLSIFFVYKQASGQALIYSIRMECLVIP